MWQASQGRQSVSYTHLDVYKRQLVSGTIYLDKSDVVTMNGNEFAKKMAVVLTDKLKTELMLSLIHI